MGKSFYPEKGIAKRIAKRLAQSAGDIGQPWRDPKPSLKKRVPLFKCQECGHKFYSAESAERASYGDKGCPGCGGSDIDIFTDDTRKAQGFGEIDQTNPLNPDWDKDLPPIKCRKCGATIPREGPGQDVDCPRCGQTHNSSGQQIDYPYGQDEGYAGERWDDDY